MKLFRGLYSVILEKKSFFLKFQKTVLAYTRLMFEKKNPFFRPNKSFFFWLAHLIMQCKSIFLCVWTSHDRPIPAEISMMLILNPFPPYEYHIMICFSYLFFSSAAENPPSLSSFSPQSPSSHGLPSPSAYPDASSKRHCSGALLPIVRECDYDPMSSTDITCSVSWEVFRFLWTRIISLYRCIIVS